MSTGENAPTSFLDPDPHLFTADGSPIGEPFDDGEPVKSCFDAAVKENW